MTHTLWTLYSDEASPEEAGAQWQERLAWATRRAMKSRERHGEDRFVDIGFRDALKDPIREIERAYDGFGIEMTTAARAAMERWRRDNPRDKRPPHQYALADYGLSEAGIRDAFAAYRERYKAKFTEPRRDR